MHQGYAKLRECLRIYPLAVSLMPQKLQNVAQHYVPFTVGMEIECQLSYDFFGAEGIHFGEMYLASRKAMEQIPGLVAAEFDDTELRFRMSNGIECLNTLYHISEWLKKNATLNNQSGIHYHVDFSTYWHEADSDRVRDQNQDWILKELDTWGYTGCFNSRRTNSTKSSWMRYHRSYRTLEFRIGEMTFDYELLAKRVLHVSAIVRRYGNILMSPNRSKLYRREKLNKLRSAAKKGRNIIFPVRIAL